MSVGVLLTVIACVFAVGRPCRCQSPGEERIRSASTSLVSQNGRTQNSASRAGCQGRGFVAAAGRKQVTMKTEWKYTEPNHIVFCI
jgi:hypothetical protein